MTDNEMIRLLASKGVLGSTPADVRRALIRRALDQLIETEFVQKWLAMHAAIRQEPKR